MSAVSTAAQQGASTRDRILDAALALFADRGVDATALDAVATAVGVRKQTLLYWFPSKEQLLFGVVDHAVAQLGEVLSAAALGAGPSIDERVEAVIDATFRLGTLRPQLLAVVREVTRVGPPATTRLAHAAEPLVAAASASLALTSSRDQERVRRMLLAAGARVVGVATEAQVRADLGLPADLAWLRARRRDLIATLVADLT